MGHCAADGARRFAIPDVRARTPKADDVAAVGLSARGGPTVGRVEGDQERSSWMTTGGPLQRVLRTLAVGATLLVMVGTLGIGVLWLSLPDWSSVNFDACADAKHPILEAAATGDLATLTRQLDAGVDPNLVAKELNTPLGCAVPHDQEAAVRLLLTRGADASRSSGDPSQGYDEYPLELAIKRRRAGQSGSMLSLLLDAGANTNVHTRKHKAPLVESMIAEDGDAAVLLLDHGADANGEVSARPLSLVWDVRSLDALINHGADPRLAFAADGPETIADRALGDAAVKGDVTLVQRWIGLGADPNRSPPAHNPLLGAVASGRTDAAAALLAAGADPNLGSIDQSTLLDSIVLEDPTTFTAVYGSPLPIGAGTTDPSSRSGTTIVPRASAPVLTPLMVAAMKGDAPMTQLLVDHGADATAAPGGMAPIYEAARGCHPDVVAILLVHGADPHGSPGSFDPTVGTCPAVKALLTP